MVNTQLLDEKINESGFKIGYIVDKIGITRQAFHLKKNNKRSFRCSEVYVLCDILHIPDGQEKKDIFFADEVH